MLHPARPTDLMFLAILASQLPQVAVQRGRKAYENCSARHHGLVLHLRCVPTSAPRKVHWIDKADGKILPSGLKWVSEDGKTLSFTVDTKDGQGKDVQYLYAFDHTR
jgi:hypothetical protein